jgi:hypothetical protein
VVDTSYTAAAVNPGDEVSVSVRAVNPYDTANKAGSAVSLPSIRVLAAAGDEDGDGMRNEAEQIAGTNALDPGSRFAASVSRAPDHATVDWAAVPGRSYRVQYRESLGSGTWVDAATGLTSGPFVHRHAGASSGFYRVVAEFPAP